jgi:hypothetical protein
MKRMKTALLCSLVLLAMLLVAGCALEVPTEFSGTWVNPSETLTLSSLNATFNDGAFGTGNFSVTSFDETTNHIQLRFNNGTGVFIYSSGTVFYMLYSVSGNTLQYAVSQSAYPVAVGGLIYTKS